MLLMVSALSAAAPMLAVPPLLAAPPMVGEKAPISPCPPSKASPEDLKGKANEFLANKQFPDSFTMLLDRDYKFTNLYGLR
jgi:hypothetical protein